MMTRRLAAFVAFLLSMSAMCLADETITRGRNLAVDASTDGRLVMDLAGDIWIVPLGGGEAAPVTRNLGSAHRPRWSPDGATIYFMSNMAGNFDIMSIPVAGGERTTVLGSDANEFGPAVSPDGESIVYASDVAGTTDLYVVSTSGGTPVQLTATPDAGEGSQAWSPDGRWIAFTSNAGGNSNLWAIPAEGGTPIQEDCSSFEDTTGRFFAGTWTCSPMRRKAQRFSRIELMCLLEGGMTLTDDTHSKHGFTAPDVLLELPDTVSAWTSTENVRKYYCIFEE